jgi:hypothetical protein
MLGLLRPAEVVAELRAQLGRFCDLTGHPPTVINAHHHVAVFGPVRRALSAVLADLDPRPFVRRVAEPMATIVRVPGARFKRVVLAALGRGRTQDYPSCETLAGVTDPARVADERFFTRWLAAGRGDTVELMCHPGYEDETLIGRDDATLASRVHEFHLLRAPDFLAAVRRAGFRLTAPGELTAARRLLAA